MNKKFRIWIINQFACTPDMPGGSRHHEIAKYFVKNGFEVDIFASDFNLSSRKFLRLNNIEFVKKELNEGVKFFWLKTFPYKKNNWKRYLNLLSFCFSFLIFNFYKILTFSLKNYIPDLIIASSPQILVSFCGLIIAKVFKIPFILEVRDLWPQVLIDLGGHDPKNILIKILSLIEYLLYREAESVVVLAKGSKNYVKAKGAKNIIWLPNGPDLEKFKYISNYSNSENFNYANPFTLIYAGAHGKANDLENVIKAASILKSYPIKFQFIGDGPEKKDLIIKAKNLKNIEFKNSVSKKIIPELLAKSNAILISLGDVKLFQYGVSPNKLYDAYALAKPVISTLKGSINEEIKKNNLGLVCDPNDPYALADIIKKMYMLPEIERKKMGLNGRRIAESTYSRNRINNVFLKLIRNILKENV
tara:strand:- start:1092 stop:2345 length:1254 start_codon:yes stop_codon:yes gene_type:complete